MTNMSRFSKIIVCAAVVISAVACRNEARIEGVVTETPDSELIVKVLNVGRFSQIDTLETDAEGRFSYKMEVEEGQPEFVYLYRGDRRVASLVVEKGDRIQVILDTLGNYSVSGSQESEKLAQVEKDHAAVLARLTAIVDKMDAVKAGSREEASLKKDLGSEYVRYYRDRVKYVMSNSRSMTIVPVLYQVVGENLPVFAQNTDAVHFRSAADSLALVYPDSKYVKALRKEADRRMAVLELEARLDDAEQIGFPEVELPDVTASKIRLGEVEGKVVLLCFWNPADASQKMFNLDVLKPLYEQWHERGLEIYQVALSQDKTSWANILKEQKLPWINVCDGMGAASRYISSYNLSSLPAIFVIHDGMLTGGAVSDEKSLKSTVARLMK